LTYFFIISADHFQSALDVRVKIDAELSPPPCLQITLRKPTGLTGTCRT